MNMETYLIRQQQGYPLWLCELEAKQPREPPQPAPDQPQATDEYDYTNEHFEKVVKHFDNLESNINQLRKFIEKENLL